MSHYDWLEKNLPVFFSNIGLNIDYVNGIITAHGDKCYGYQWAWEKANIPFEHGVAIFLLSYLKPYSSESGETRNGWVNVKDWVIANYQRFQNHLPPISRS